MKLNCDLGESFGIWQLGDDEAVMPFIDIANIACGFHAADPMTMTRTVRLAQAHNVLIYAHPGYPDLQGFGRRSMSLSPDEITALVLYQVGALQAICHSENTLVRGVKPHGALYNDMLKDSRIFSAIVQAISQLNASETTATQPLTLVTFAGPDSAEHQAIADKAGVPLSFECFADRQYTSEGLLVSRRHPDAVITDDAILLPRIQTLLEHKIFTDINGQPLPIKADTLCVHGDNPAAIALTKKIRNLLNQQNSNNAL